MNDDEFSVEVRNWARDFFVVADVVAKKFCVFVVQLEGRHLRESIEGIFGGEKFALGCGGGFEPRLRTDLVCEAQDGVHGRLLWVAGDVEGAQPAGDDDASEDEETDGPAKERVTALRMARGRQVTHGALVGVGHGLGEVSWIGGSGLSSESAEGGWGGFWQIALDRG